MKLLPTHFHDPEPKKKDKGFDYKKARRIVDDKAHTEWIKRQVKPEPTEKLLIKGKSHILNLKMRNMFPKEWKQYRKALTYYNENRLRYGGFEVKGTPEEIAGWLFERGDISVLFNDHFGEIEIRSAKFVLKADEVSTEALELLCTENGTELEILNN